jgi:hypothetical protein
VRVLIGPFGVDLWVGIVAVTVVVILVAIAVEGVELRWVVVLCAGGVIAVIVTGLAKVGEVGTTLVGTLVGITLVGSFIGALVKHETQALDLPTQVLHRITHHRLGRAGLGVGSDSLGPWCRVGPSSYVGSPVVQSWRPSSGTAVGAGVAVAAVVAGIVEAALIPDRAGIAPHGVLKIAGGLHRVRKVSRLLGENLCTQEGLEALEEVGLEHRGVVALGVAQLRNKGAETVAIVLGRLIFLLVHFVELGKQHLELLAKALQEGRLETLPSVNVCGTPYPLVGVTAQAYFGNGKLSCRCPIEEGAKVVQLVEPLMSLLGLTTTKLGDGVEG